MTGTPGVKYFCRIFYVSFRDKPSYDRRGGRVQFSNDRLARVLPMIAVEVTKGQ